MAIVKSTEVMIAKGIQERRMKCQATRVADLADASYPETFSAPLPGER